ncbi:MAG: hypothetical protein BGO67_12805 [Alphaproteobacteria bacterium 41-28]|nr:MAG: hypothetical protein BGO67_12805 [Alphaproteobacteria bacterium 41-28]
MLGKRLLLVTGLLNLLGGCDLIDHRYYHDPCLKLQKEDYEKMTKPPPYHKEISSFQPKLSALPKAASLTPGMRKEVSLTLHENMCFKTVLMELGHQAGVGMALSSQIASEKIGILYSAHHLPFIDVIKDICSLTGL